MDGWDVVSQSAKCLLEMSSIAIRGCGILNLQQSAKKARQRAIKGVKKITHFFQKLIKDLSLIQTLEG